MIFQILLRDSYRFDEAKYLLFLKTLQSYRKKQSFIERLTDSNMSFEWIIDCDSHDKVSFYMIDNTKTEDIFNNNLEKLLGSDADIIKVNELEAHSEHQTLVFNASVIEREGANTTYTQLKTFDSNVLGYIIAMMPKNTRITIAFDIKPLNWKDMKKGRGYQESDHSEVECMIDVSAKTKYMRRELTSLSQTIQRVTSFTGKFDISFKKKYKPFKISTSYLLNLIAMPTIDYDQQKIYVLKSNQKTLTIDELNEGIMIGYVDHPLQSERKVKVPISQIEKHVLLTGSTGSGKSAVWEVMARDIIIQQINGTSKVGFTYFDPAETSALGLINIVRQLKSEGYAVEKIEEKIHYIDFTSNELIFPINLLSSDVERAKHMDYFRDIFGEGNTPQLDRLLINSISSLMDDTKQHVISDVIPLLKDESYRFDVINRLKKNRFAVSNVEFLVAGIPSAANAIDPVLNRLDIFTNSLKKKQMFTSGKNNLSDIKMWMDDGHIIIVNLSSMAAKDIQIIAGYWLLQYYNCAIKRSMYSNPHLVAIDEDHKVQLKIVTNIRAECRKFGLHFIGMTQFLDQYSDRYLEDALENSATKITLRQGEVGANRMAKSSDVHKEEYKTLADRHGYIYTQIKGQFKSVGFVVDPPYRYFSGKLIEYGKIDFNKKIAKAIDSDRVYARELLKKDSLDVSAINDIIFEIKNDVVKDDIFG